MDTILAGIVEGLGNPLEKGKDDTLTTWSFRNLATHFKSKGQIAALVKNCLDEFDHDPHVVEVLGDLQRWT
jgi:hypothetical protein